MRDERATVNVSFSGTPSAICRRCKRPLSDARSIKAGMGPVCRGKCGQGGAATGGNDTTTVADLPFDVDTFDIVCRRDHARSEGPAGDGRHFNINQVVVVHSHTGFEWGYGGSGPADFALNILDLFARVRLNEAADCQAGRGAEGRCSQFAWDFHQDFKGDFIAKLPELGGTIRGADVEAWVAQRYTAWALERSLTAEGVA